MENKINTGNQNAQQDEQNPVSQSVQLPEKPKINYWMVSVVLLLVIILLVGGVWLVKNKTSLGQRPVTSNQESPTVVTGVIRTSGLSEEEKQKFGLTTVNYQITDLINNNGQPAIDGYYLQTGKNSVPELLGKCVKINGTVPNEWKNRGYDDIPYARVAFDADKIEIVDYSQCNPFAYSATQDFIESDMSRFEGTAIYAQRPAPDIHYDYQLKLNKPYFDDPSSSGMPQNVSFIDISPSSHSLWRQLEDSINKEVTIDGYMTWGYSETRYLQIVNISQGAAMLTTAPAATKAGYKKVQLFYYNKTLDPKTDCLSEAVVPVNREILITKTPIQDTIRLLIEGKLTTKEKADGFSTEFPHPEFKLLGANLKDRTLTLDFPEVPSFTTGGSCRVGLLHTEIEKTAKQFPEVKGVRYTKDSIFQP